MKIVNASVELLKTDNPLKLVELAGRVCYKSEEHTTKDSYIGFVDKMIKSGHHAMLEHVNYTFAGTYVLSKALTDTLVKNNDKTKYIKETLYNTTITLRTLTELNIKLEQVGLQMYDYDELDTLPIKERIVHKHITLKIVCNRRVSHELVRHRVFSFAMESQRYCNYSKGRFGNELTFIEPKCYSGSDRFLWADTMKIIEKRYMYLINKGYAPQEAGGILTNDVKTEIVMTGNLAAWKHFLDLRYKETTGKVHPQMLEVSTMARDILVKEDEEVFYGY